MFNTKTIDHKGLKLWPTTPFTKEKKKAIVYYERNVQNERVLLSGRSAKSGIMVQALIYANQECSQRGGKLELKVSTSKWQLKSRDKIIGPYWLLGG